MALSANTVWEVRTTGSDTNGGGFVTGASGTDWSQQDAAQYSVTDAVTDGSTTITSATANFGTDVVGNILYIQGGTGSITAGWYQITARTNSTTITVDRSTGLTTGTGATLKIGGAFASLSPFSPNILAVASNIIWMKTGTYNTSSTWTIGVTGGGQVAISLQGYNTTRDDDNGKPLISSTSTGVALNASGAGISIINIEIDGNDSATYGINFNDNGARGAVALKCKISRCATGGITAGSSYILCEVTDLKAGASACFIGGRSWYCYAHDTPGVGFIGDLTSHSECVASYCIASGCQSSGFRVTNSGSDLMGSELFNCVAYNCTGVGFDIDSIFYNPPIIINCIAYGNSTYGFGGTSMNSTIAKQFYRNNAAGNNTSGDYSTSAYKGSGSVDLTTNPFVDAATGNFALNNTVGGGATCRSAGIIGTFPGGLTTGYLDIGAAQTRTEIINNMKFIGART